MATRDPHLADADPEIAALATREAQRQAESIRLIASENYASRAVMEATATVLANKYSEGYPHKRYYEGQQVVDQVEELARSRVAALFHLSVPFTSTSSRTRAARRTWPSTWPSPSPARRSWAWACPPVAT
ncbi:MAG: hypothetical protein WKG00_18540 [Polyangiaceae bacterium]